MTGVNWGLNQGSSFQNALAMGMNMGAQARQAKQQNALLEQRQQQLDLQARAQQREVQQQQQTSDLTQRVLSGDEGALDELATVNFDRWKTLSADQKAKAKEESTVFAQAALDIMQAPPEQRRARIIGYAQQFPEYAEKINGLAFLPPEEQDVALRGVIIDGQLVGKLHAMEDPSYQRLAPGEVFVNTKDPAAVSQFESQPAQSSYGEGQTAVNPQTGQRLVFRNGSWRPM